MIRRRSSIFKAPRAASTYLLLFILLLLSQATDLFAAPPTTAAIEKKIAEQSRQIDLRRDAAKLTDAEAAVLRDNLTFIRTTEANLRGGGKENKKKRQELNRMLEINNKMIHKKKYYPIKSLALSP